MSPRLNALAKLIIPLQTSRYILSIERNANVHPGDSLAECNNAGNLSSECCYSHPCDAHSSVDRLQDVLVSHPRSFQMLSSNSLSQRGSSSLQRVPDSHATSHSTTTGAHSDLTRQVTSSASTRTASTRNRSSKSSHTTQETGITVPSVSARTSVDIDIGSLHSTSSVTSAELREFWNDIWSGDDGAFGNA